MQVRKATATDAAAISTVGSVVQQLHHEQRPDWFKPVRIEELEPFYVELLEDPEALAFIAEDESGPVGFILLKVTRRPETAITWPLTIVSIDQVAVVERVRRLGVAHALFQAVRDVANEVEAQRIHLTTWDFNTGAHRFFESEGLSPDLRRMYMRWPHTSSGEQGR